MKRRIKAMLAAGATVEPGPNRLEEVTRFQALWTKADQLARLGLSKQQAAELMASVPKKACKYLLAEVMSAARTPRGGPAPDPRPADEGDKAA
jgi:hypothetical protein